MHRFGSRERCSWSLCGNHDFTFFQNTPINLNKSLQEAHARNRKLLEPRWNSGSETRARWNWFKSLEPKKSVSDALFVHGSARDPLFDHPMEDDFLFFGDTQSVMAQEVFNFTESVCFCAHTYQPGIVLRAEEWKRPESFQDLCGNLDPQHKIIVNVGSVGQPRDRDPRACYVVWDDLQHTVIFNRVPYDLEAARRRFIAVPELPIRFWHRLVEGI